MKNKIIGWYSIILGISLIGLWTLIFLVGEITQGKTEIIFHLISEAIMVSLCIASGIMLLKKHLLAQNLNIIGLGMALYSIINSAGYYGENNETGMMIMFFVLFIFTALALLWNFISVFPLKKA